MSGPCTLEYLLIQGSILGLAGAGAVMTRSALAVHRGIGEAQAEHLQRHEEMVASQRSQYGRERDAIQHLATRIAQLEAGLHRLNALSAVLQPSLAEQHEGMTFTVPAAPSERDAQSLERYAVDLEQALGSARHRLAAAGEKLLGTGRAVVDAGTLDRLVEPKSLADLLDAYVETGRRQRSSEALATRQALVRKLLAPLQADGAVPPSVETILREFAGTLDESRADALTLQLRHEVATERARREASARQRQIVEGLLGELADLAMIDAGGARVDPLRQTLELCAVGLVDLDDKLAHRARSLIASLRSEAAEATRTAAALILESALKDLGFVVEPIAETLFIEGGVAHFTRPEWGEYAVRLRTVPTEGTLNFNVVREPGAAAQDRLSTRLRDGRAEEAWCAHIPNLQNALEARGIKLKVARLLGAGEAPAQVVPEGTLGTLHREAQPAPARAATLRRAE